MSLKPLPSAFLEHFHELVLDPVEKVVPDLQLSLNRVYSELSTCLYDPLYWLTRLGFRVDMEIVPR